MTEVRLDSPKRSPCVRPWKATSRRCWRSIPTISSRGVGDVDPEPLHDDDIKRRRKNMLRAPAAASGGRTGRHRRGLCLCRAVPQAAGLPLCRQALDLCASRPSAFGRRPAAAAGADRCLRGGGLSPDVRLYRRRRTSRRRSCTRPLAFERAGLLKDVGFKFGRWTDSLLMQRALGPGAAEPPADDSYSRTT